MVRIRSLRPVSILWGVNLMAYIPNYFIIWRIKHLVQCNGQLYNAEACAQNARQYRIRYQSYRLVIHRPIAANLYRRFLAHLQGC